MLLRKSNFKLLRWDAGWPGGWLGNYSDYNATLLPYFERWDFPELQTSWNLKIGPSVAIWIFALLRMWISFNKCDWRFTMFCKSSTADQLSTWHLALTVGVGEELQLLGNTAHEAEKPFNKAWITRSSESIRSIINYKSGLLSIFPHYTFPINNKSKSKKLVYFVNLAGLNK